MVSSALSLHLVLPIRMSNTQQMIRMNTPRHHQILHLPQLEGTRGEPGGGGNVAPLHTIPKLPLVGPLVSGTDTTAGAFASRALQIDSVGASSAAAGQLRPLFVCGPLGRNADNSGTWRT